MKLSYKIFLFLLILVLFSTYNPNNSGYLKNEKSEKIFNVKNVEIYGNNIITDEEINLYTQYFYERNIFLINPKIFIKDIHEIDFLNKVKVKKKYPNTIKIQIFEEKPIAIFSKNKNKFFITSSSKLIKFKENIKFQNLPYAFGKDSEIYLSGFIKNLERENFPIDKIKKFYFFQSERWDIQLKNDQIIKFPFTNVIESINQSIILLNRKDFKKYQVIDLRINDKIITE